MSAEKGSAVLHVWATNIGMWGKWRLANLKVTKEITHVYTGKFIAPNKTALVNRINCDDVVSSARERFRKHTLEANMPRNRWFTWGDIVIEDKQAWMMIHPDGWVPVEMQDNYIAELAKELKPESERQAHGIADVGGHR